MPNSRLNPLEKVSCNLTKAQHKKLVSGGSVQLSASALKGTKNFIMVPHKTGRKMRSAVRADRGVRISMSPEEMAASGHGLKEFLHKAGKYYKEEIKPKYGKYVKQGVRGAAELGLKALEVSQPWTIPAVEYGRQKYLEQGVDALGRVTGAYGIKETAKQVGELYTRHVKKHVAPHLKSAVRRGAKSLVSQAKKRVPKYAKEISALEGRYLEPAVTELGRLTGAYGLLNAVRNTQSSAAPKLKIAGNYRTKLAADHPAMWPTTPYLQPIGGYITYNYAKQMQSGGKVKSTVRRMPKKSSIQKSVSRSSMGGSFRPV